MGPKHAPPFEFRSGQYLDYLEKTLALCLDQKKFKNVGKNWLRKLKGENWGSGFTQKQFGKIYTNVTKGPPNGRHSG